MIILFPGPHTPCPILPRINPCRKTGQVSLSTGLVSILLALVLTACSGKDTPPKPEWTRAEKAIRLTFKADSQANFYDGQPHAVAVAVYQLAEPGGFAQLITYPAGLQQLLTASPQLPPSLASEQFFLQPGETTEKIYDRAEGARWLVLAAGLYTASPENSAKLIQIPVEIESSWLTFSKTAAIPPYVQSVLLKKDQMQLETTPQ